MCRIDSRTIDGVEIYDIGQEQYIELSKWNPVTGGIGGNSGVYRHAKGLWVIVSVSTCFGGRTFGNRITVEGVYSTRAAALDMCTYYVEHFLYSEKHLIGTLRQRYLPAYARDFEIWHIVDDGELWNVWDMEAAAAGGDLQAAQAFDKVFHDDQYLRRIEEQYEGDYHVYDSMVHSPAACIADLTQHDLKSGYKYVYRYWDCCARFLEQRVEDTISAAITCRGYRDDGYKPGFVQVYDMEQSECLSVLRDDGSIPVWNPLRVCDVRWEPDYDY